MEPFLETLSGLWLSAVRDYATATLPPEYAPQVEVRLSRPVSLCVLLLLGVRLSAFHCSVAGTTSNAILMGRVRRCSILMVRAPW